MELTRKRYSNLSTEFATHLQRQEFDTSSNVSSILNRLKSKFHRRNRLVSALERPVTQKRGDFRRVFGNKLP